MPMSFRITRVSAERCGQRSLQLPVVTSLQEQKAHHYIFSLLICSKRFVYISLQGDKVQL